MTDLAWIGWLSELLAAPGATAAGVAVELGWRTDQSGAAEQLRILAPSIPGAHEASVLRGRDGRPDVALVILGAGEALRLGDLEGALGPAEELGGSTSPLRSVALRAGWWRDPSRFDFVPGFGTTVTHRTFGAGINVGRARLDLAYDHANLAAQRRAAVGLGFGL